MEIELQRCRTPTTGSIRIIIHIRFTQPPIPPRMSSASPTSSSSPWPQFNYSGGDMLNVCQNQNNRCPPVQQQQQKQRLGFSYWSRSDVPGEQEVVKQNGGDNYRTHPHNGACFTDICPTTHH